MKKNLLILTGLIIVTSVVVFLVRNKEDDSSSQNKTSNESSFTIDEGYRADYASNPFIILSAGSTLVMAYESRAAELKNNPSERAKIIKSTDGLTFSSVSDHKGRIVPPPTHLPDGTYRRYTFDSQKGGLTSESSTDGKTYTADSGIRFTPSSSKSQDERTFGVSTYYTDADGGVVLLYNATDKNGDVVVNRAYAKPETKGLIFVLEKEDILDETLDAEHYADPHTVVLSNKDIWLVVMNQTKGAKPPIEHQGVIYGYQSTDGGKTFGDPVRLLGWDDVKEFDVYSLNDPKIVEFPKGTVRIYVAAMIPDTSQDADEQYKWLMISASTSQL